MTVMFLVVCLGVAIAFESTLVDLPLHILNLVPPLQWVCLGFLLLVIGWSLGE